MLLAENYQLFFHFLTKSHHKEVKNVIRYGLLMVFHYLCHRFDDQQCNKAPSKDIFCNKMMIGKYLFILISTVLIICSCGSTASKNKITAEMALEGVSNYCHSTYDWSISEDNPSIMGVEMVAETDSAYQVVFRSYTGALVNFYVDKASGTTRMVESVPALNIEEAAGTIDLFDYLDKEE